LYSRFREIEKAIPIATSFTPQKPPITYKTDRDLGMYWLLLLKNLKLAATLQFLLFVGTAAFFRAIM
jgi:hypothetical protein